MWDKEIALTRCGLKRHQLIKNKDGKIISKKVSEIGKNHPWLKAVAEARKLLKIKGWTAVKKGTPLYAKAKDIYISKYKK